MADVLMPKLSDTMEEGRIIRWLKQRGDRVAIGDILAEVETDKANMELEAFDEGTLAEIRTAEGESAPIGAVIAVLSEAGAEKGAAAPAATAEKAAPKPAAEPAPVARE
ncbi:MAG TPA: biotin/lipoyl-containing protein, partial [Candidatus Binatia bacterium]|nr:biotin/lipoyl-containing protein [Candidatus Binatia bacterium]